MLAVVVVIIAWPRTSDAPDVDSDSTASRPTIPATAQATVNRTDQAIGGVFQVRLTNTGADDFTVLAVRLESPGFETLAYTPRDTFFSPGETTDLPTPYGAVRCDPGDAADPARAAVRFRLASGETGETRIPLESPHGELPKLHAGECDKAFIEESVEIAIAEPIEEAGSGPTATASAVVTIDRVATDETVVVSDIRGSVMYRVMAQRLPVTLEQGTDRAALPIEIVPARCDGHALGETKQPYVYPIRIAIGDEFESAYDLPVTKSQQEQLFDFLVRACGFG